MRSIIADLTPASERRDHTTSPSAKSCARLAQPPRPSHPAAHVRDDRETPLMRKRDGNRYRFDLGERRSGIFFAGRLDRWNRIELVRQIRFCARRASGPAAIVFCQKLMRRFAKCYRRSRAHENPSQTAHPGTTELLGGGVVVRARSAAAGCNKVQSPVTSEPSGSSHRLLRHQVVCRPAAVRAGADLFGRRVRGAGGLHRHVNHSRQFIPGLQSPCSLRRRMRATSPETENQLPWSGRRAFAMTAQR
jgi:hypothetical protein